MHSVTVCTVPTASAEPAIATASTHRLARVIGLEPAVPWLPVVVVARLGEYLRRAQHPAWTMCSFQVKLDQWVRP